MNPVSLKSFNSFGVNAFAARLLHVYHEEDLPGILTAVADDPYLILGGGSNMLFVQDFPGWVIRMAIPGIHIEEDYEDYAIVSAGAGVVWNDLVQFALKHQLGGLENLSLIPGTVGAAPIQNIGAYGVELADVFCRLRGYDRRDRQFHFFDKEGCHFGYRDSVFKRKFRSDFFITKVWFKLFKAPHVLKLSYGSLSEELNKAGIARPGIKEVSEMVCKVRVSKLPDPSQIGNAGSFFKNPEVPQSEVEPLLQQYPDLPHWPIAGEKVKLSAAWMIEQAGWKGKVYGNTGTYARHALVLVNHGEATGQEIWEHAMRIIQSVEEQFGIRLEPEVNIIRQ